MAAAVALTALARCKRKRVLDAFLVGNSSARCKIGDFISNILRPGVFFIRSFASKVPFPWSQSSTDIYLKDPLLHRLCGSFLLYRALKKVPNGQLDPSQFLNEAKNCILMVCSLLRTLDPENKLSEVLGSTLGKYFKEALTRIKDPNSNLNIHLDLAKLGDLRISGVCCALGPLVPSEHDFLLDFLGQQVFIVPEDMEHLRGRDALSSEKIKKVSQGSLDRGFRFQIGVKFWSQEKFYVTGPMGKVVQGSKDFVYSHHLWQFESLFDWEKYHNGQYPLCWTVADIDKLVAWNLPTHRKFSSFFN